MTKITAALIICGTTMALCSAIYILVSDSLFGWECTKTSMQILFSITSLLDMNVLELQLFTAATGLLAVRQLAWQILKSNGDCLDLRPYL